MSKRSPRISDAFNLHNRKMTDAEIEEIARGMFRALLSKLEGPPDEVQSWIDCAKKFGLVVRGFKAREGDPDGYYQHNQSGSGKTALGVPAPPVLYYNIKAPKEMRILIITHEIGHFLAASWPRSTWGRVALELYDDVRQSAQHRACVCMTRMVRDTFFCAE
jgi:hypothetical protein